MFVEARHQPELHLIVRNIIFGMTTNNDGDGYDGQGEGDHSDDVDDDDEDADAGGNDGDDVDHGVTCSPSPLLSTPRNCRMLSWLSCKSSLNIFYRHVTKKIIDYLGQIINLLFGKPALFVLQGEDLHRNHLLPNLGQAIS